MSEFDSTITDALTPEAQNPHQVDWGGFEEYQLILQANLYENLAVARERAAEERAQRALEQEQAGLDGMLGIYTKTRFETLVTETAETAWRQGDGPVSTLLFIDLDHFKAVNDSAGHAAGDEVLKAVAQALKDTIRDDDLVGRLGGEELGVMLHNTPVTKVIPYLARLRAALAEIERPGGGFKGHITASIGAAEIRAGENTYGEAIAAADDAMYAIKHNRLDPRDGAAIVIDGEIRQIAFDDPDLLIVLPPPER